MQRFGRKLNVAEMRASLPLSVLFFDILYLDGVSLIGEPARDRYAALETGGAGEFLLPRLLTGDAEEADRFSRMRSPAAMRA